MGLKDKIIAFDIDGTLARNSSIPSLYTINEITRLINEGYHITLSTGRNIVSSINIYNSCNMKDLCVLCNGAMVYDPINNKKITNVTIPLNVVYELIENKELINYVDDLLIEIDFDTYALTGNVWPNAKYIGNFKETLKNEPNAIVFFLKDAKYQENVAKIINTSKDYHYRYWFKQGEFYNLNFSKKEGMEELLKYYNKTNEDLIFFGDGENDKELLEFAGIGVAMKNAADDVKEVADQVSEFDNDNDGAIKHLLKMLERDL